MRGRWKAKMGMAPQPHRDLSDNQLSVLSRLSDGRANLLAWDMAGWGHTGRGVSGNM